MTIQHTVHCLHKSRDLQLYLTRCMEHTLTHMCGCTRQTQQNHHQCFDPFPFRAIMASVIIIILVPVEEGYKKQGRYPQKTQDGEVEREQNCSICKWLPSCETLAELFHLSLFLLLLKRDLNLQLRLVVRLYDSMHMKGLVGKRDKYISWIMTKCFTCCSRIRCKAFWEHSLWRMESQVEGQG